MSVYSYIEKIIGYKFIPFFEFESILNERDEFMQSLHFNFDINNSYKLIENVKYMPDLIHCIFSLAIQKCYNRVENKGFYSAILKSYDEMYKDIIKNYLDNPSNKSLERSFLRTISISGIQDNEIQCLCRCNFSIIKEFMKFLDLKIILLMM